MNEISKRGAAFFNHPRLALGDYSRHIRTGCDIGAIRIDGARIVTALGIAARIRPFESSANRSAERVL